MLGHPHWPVGRDGLIDQERLRTRVVVVVVSKSYINTYVPIFRHRIASQTEKNIKKQAEINLSGVF